MGAVISAQRKGANGMEPKYAKNRMKKFCGRKYDRKKLLLLHITIVIFALSAVASKAASLYMSRLGLISMQCMGCLCLYAVLTVVYAAAWQYSLEKFELSFLYTNKSFYMIWSQIFAVIIFREQIFWNNLAGLLLIFAGVWVNSKDVK